MSEAQAHLAAALRPGGILPAEAVPGLIQDLALGDLDGLLRALLPLAQGLARPPISGFRVGAAGLLADSGDILLGANLEFAGGAIADTVHAEQFLFSRAHARGDSIVRMAVSARPCGHCRQFMREFRAADRLVILDPEQGPLGLGDLLPLSFGPDQLALPPADPARREALMMESGQEGLNAPLRAALLDAGSRAHAPHSGAPAAVALGLQGGAIIAGAVIENAAYNPGLPPLQAALIALAAHGREPADIETAVLAQRAKPAFDHGASTARLLAIIAPSAWLEQVSWRPARSS